MSAEITPELTTNSESKPPLEIAIEHYGAKLDQLASSETTVTETSIYETLLARDAVENLLAQRFEGQESCLTKLVELDQRLKAHNDLIGTTPNLKNWRDVLNPPETAWWWYVSPTPVVHVWDQLDWLWNMMMLSKRAAQGAIANLP